MPLLEPWDEERRRLLGRRISELGLSVRGSRMERLVNELYGELAARAELVFNVAEAFREKSALESNVASLLNLLDLRYTGSSPAGLMLAGERTLAKKVLGFHGIRTPEFASVYRGAVDWAGDIAFPLIVKPPQEDASVGITGTSIVHDVRELLERIHELQMAYPQPVLVEQFIEGREFYVGVLGNDGEGGGAAFAHTTSDFPEDLAPALAEEMGRVAVAALQALRLRDYARIDLRVTAAGEVYVLEANPNCYLERDSEFARAASRAGLAYESRVARIADLAMAR